MPSLELIDRISCQETRELAKPEMRRAEQELAASKKRSQALLDEALALKTAAHLRLQGLQQSRENSLHHELTNEIRSAAERLATEDNSCNGLNV